MGGILQEVVLLIFDCSGGLLVGELSYLEAGYIELYFRFVVYRLNFLVFFMSVPGGHLRTLSSHIWKYSFLIAIRSEISVDGRLLDDAECAPLL